MPFITKPDYSDNRQIKQFQLTSTQLSGTTVFGIDDAFIPVSSADTINIDALQYTQTRGLIFPDTIPVFTGATYQVLGRDNSTGKVVEVDGVIPSNEIIPLGTRGNMLYYENYNSRDLYPDFPLRRGIITETQAELDYAKLITFSLEEVFLTWQMFSHSVGSPFGPETPPNYPSLVDESGDTVNLVTEEEFYSRTIWQYDNILDRIYLVDNLHPYTGFISPDKYANYTFEATMSSTSADDDTIGLVIGYYKDPLTGYEKTLSVTRNLAGGPSYAVLYNFHQVATVENPDYDPFTLNNGSLLAPLEPGNWNVEGPSRVQVIRSGNTFNIKCSQYGSEVIDNATLITIDLDVSGATYPQLNDFKDSSQIGFGAHSQPNASFTNIVFSGFTDYIFNILTPTTYETWEYDQGIADYFLQSPRTTHADDYFRISHFVYSYLFGKTYYVTEYDTFINITGSASFSGLTGTGTTINTDDYTTGATLNGETLEFTRLSGSTYSVELTGFTGNTAALIYSGTSIHPTQGVHNALGEFSTIGGGTGHTVTFKGNTISGGRSNRIAGKDVNDARYSTIGGGYNNSLSGNSTTIGGGEGNRIEDNYDCFSTIGGGQNNRIWVDRSTISGGYFNQILLTGSTSTISGGYSNTANAAMATIAGGRDNSNSGGYGVIGGGQDNAIVDGGHYGTIAGGRDNTITIDGFNGAIGGGRANTVSEYRGTIGGGFENTASGQYSTVSGGYRNIASNYYSTVTGGFDNTASGRYSTASGYYNTAWSYGETSIGLHGTLYTGTSQTAWSYEDRLFNIGNGTGTGDRSDAFQILKSGEIIGSSLSTDIIASGDVRTLITKEYLVGFSGATGTTTPAGNDTEIQFNDAGSFGASSGFTWDNSTNRLGISGVTQTGIFMQGSGTDVSGRTNFTLQNTSSDSAARFKLLNSDGGAISVQASGPTYLSGRYGSWGTAGGLDMNFQVDGDLSSGGGSTITFNTGGWEFPNVSMFIEATGHVTLPSLTIPMIASGDPKTAITKEYLTGATSSPAGNDTEIQFNDAGSFGASSGFTWDGEKVMIEGQSSGEIYHALNVTTTGNTGRSAPLSVSFSDTSTDLTNALSGIVLFNTDKTNNNYSSWNYSSYDTSDVGYTFGNMAVQFVNHTTGAKEADYVFNLRDGGGGVMSERMRIAGGTGYITGDRWVTNGGLVTEFVKGDGTLGLISSINSGNTLQVVTDFGNTTTTDITTANIGLLGTLTIDTPAIAGREDIIIAQVDDNSTDVFIVANGTTTGSRFIPTFVGFTDGAYQTLLFRGLGLTSNDTVGNADVPYIEWLAANTTSSSDPNNGTFSQPSERMLFSWATINDIRFLTITADGTVIAPELTTTLIDAEPTGRVLVTREYVTGSTSGFTGGGDDYTTGVTLSGETLEFTRLSGSTYSVELTGFTTVLEAYTETGVQVSGNTIAQIGDYTSVGSKTLIEVDDVAQDINFSARGFVSVVDPDVAASTFNMFNDSSTPATSAAGSDGLLVGIKLYEDSEGVTASFGTTDGTTTNLSSSHDLEIRSGANGDVDIYAGSSGGSFILNRAGTTSTWGTGDGDNIMIQPGLGATAIHDVSTDEIATGHSRSIVTKEYLSGFTSGQTANTDDYTTSATLDGETLEFSRISGGTYSVELTGFTGIGGSIAIDQVAVGSGTDTIEGTGNFSYNGAARTLYIGANDLARGQISLYGDDTNGGGKMNIYNEGDADTNDDYYEVKADNGSFALAGISTGTFFTYLSSTQYVGLPDYGGGTKIGSATYVLAVDTSGNIVEEPFSGLTGTTTGTTTVNTDDYVTGATFNTSDGVITLDMLSGSTVTVDIDGRYLEGVSGDTTPTLGGSLSLGGNPFTDNYSIGEATISQFDLCSLKSGENGMFHTDNTTLTSIQGQIGMATAAGSSGSTAEFYVYGKVPMTGFTQGDVLYAGLSGTVVTTPYTNTGYTNKVIGHGIDSNYIFLNPSADFFKNA